MLVTVEMAVRQRQPSEVVHHSGRGCRYTSASSGRRCIDVNLQPSMGFVGNASDHAKPESFCFTFECTLIAPKSIKTKSQGSRELFLFIEGSSCGFRKF